MVATTEIEEAAWVELVARTESDLVELRERMNAVEAWQRANDARLGAIEARLGRQEKLLMDIQREAQMARHAYAEAVAQQAAVLAAQGEATARVEGKLDKLLDLLQPKAVL